MMPSPSSPPQWRRTDRGSDRERFDTDFHARADKYGFQGIVNLYEGLGGG